MDYRFRGKKKGPLALGVYPNYSTHFGVGAEVRWMSLPASLNALAISLTTYG